MTPSSRSTAAPASDRVIARLFARLQARYGHKWTSQIPNAEMVRLAAAEWADGLAGLTNEQIAEGLAEWDGDWPPSLPEFRKACLRLTDPSSNDEWMALGNRIGVPPNTGEDWPAYIARVRRAAKSAAAPGGALTLPALTGPGE